MRTTAVVAVVVALAGCAGDDGDDEAEREAFLAQVEAVCVEHDARALRIPKPRDFTGFPAYSDRVAPIVEEELEQLRELDPPDELEEDYDRLLDGIDASLEAIRRMRENYNDPAAVEDATRELEDAARDTREAAQKLDLRGCAAL